MASPTKEAFGEPTGKAFHPAIVEITELIGTAPNAILYDEIIDTLGNVFDRTRLRKLYRDWISKGYNPKNLDWLFDWYANGVAPKSTPAELKRLEAAISACPICTGDGLYEVYKGTWGTCKHPPVQHNAAPEGNIVAEVDAAPKTVKSPSCDEPDSTTAIFNTKPEWAL